MTAKDELKRVLVICEAGVNHNGSLERALGLVDAAVEAGADVVKFQTFKAEQIVTVAAPKAAYQDRNAPEYRSQLEMLKALELDADAHRALLQHCQRRGIQFLSTPFDSQSVQLLAGELGLTLLKVSSGDLTNAPLLLQMAQSGARLILSTGMATMEEIEEALGVVAFGYLGGPSPSRTAFRAAWASGAGKAIVRERVSILHCTSDYPAQLGDVNLRAMDTLRDQFGLRTGYSDHTQGIVISLAAAARGAEIIEKHLTLDRNLPGPDHRASLEPGEFAEMVAGIRAIETALGTAEKRPTAAELSTRKVARKTIVAAKAIERGEVFTVENLTTKRAGAGKLPAELWDLVGHPAQRAYAADELIDA
ncbi:N-acetylneuraminate synthase [Dongia rigui]|uniref:N-acetylneuraminate synthase n=1 Tax=Dongia rigui TaxID=940149 RepID=A0ABU5E266_9PROT|nr:N-acetylneuraminate synthase [Dongia rigui]MDY0873655.1 N-acetylneuraminate synthase [Dongia rigui]